jgi:diaminopimelate epimerase
MTVPFTKYHALGNDYIVLDPADMDIRLTEAVIRRICNRHCGVGSDGILLGPGTGTSDMFSLRIFNPDGSEAEKSGNGLRIFSRYLFERGLVSEQPFQILTAGGTVRSQVSDRGRLVSVEMGVVSFNSTKIPVSGPPREVIEEQLAVHGENLLFCAATIGNPHCVIPQQEISAERARRIGPAVEIHPLFPNRTNVQLMQVLDRGNIRIEIWERGAGYTLASGSSSCAAAAVAYKLGRCDESITVHMPGGRLEIELSPEYAVSMTGPVTRICAGNIDNEMFL